MSKTSENDLVFLAVGDVLPERRDPASIFRHVAPTLRQGDVVFCQLEANISERGTRLPQARHTTRIQRETATALKDTGFNVVSFAGNHCMDWGREAFFDTIEALESESLTVPGVGKNIEDARRPRIVEAGGVKIAFIAYSSILPMNYWAEADRPGCAPMRAWTHYEQIEHDQPGTPCRIHTFPHREDLAHLIADIEEARRQADIVVMSIHWGIHFVPAVIADYQRLVAHAAIDAGVDLILGHHAHILKGVEVYKGKPIFYSLCNFAMDLPMTPEHAQSKGFREIQVLHPDWKIDFGSNYNFPPDSQKTMVVKCLFNKEGISRVSLLPAFIDRTADPQILAASDPRFSEVLDYLREITTDQKLSASFRIEGDEVMVSE